MVPTNTSPTFAGVQYPFREDRIYNFVVDDHAINAGLHQLFMTEPGERLNRLDFGVPLRQYMFDQLSPEIMPFITAEIAAAIERWEKRIVVVDPPGIVVEESTESEHAIHIFFRWAWKDNLAVTSEFKALIKREEGPIAFADGPNPVSPDF